MNISLITSVPVVPPWDQGDKKLAYTLALALPQHRFNVLTVANSRAPFGANLSPHPVFRSPRPSLRERAAIYWQLLTQPAVPWQGLLAPQRPDIYHLVYHPDPLTSWLGPLIPKFWRGPSVQTLPAIANFRSKASLRSSLFADRIVTVSKYGLRRLQQLGVKNAMHIPPGIDTQAWGALECQTNRFKSEAGLRGCHVVLFPGHYGPGRGADVMIKALPKLVEAVPTVRVVFACRRRSPLDRSREHSLQQELDRLGLTDHVRFFNTMPKMETLIGASDVVALPVENMRNKLDIPTTLLEAMAAAKPIVIADVLPMRELILGTEESPLDKDQVGMVVPVQDPSALANSLIALFSDQTLRERMGRHGQALVRQHYDIKHVASQYEELYQSLVH